MPTGTRLQRQRCPRSPIAAAVALLFVASACSSSTKRSAPSTPPTTVQVSITAAATSTTTTIDTTTIAPTTIPPATVAPTTAAPTSVAETTTLAPTPPPPADPPAPEAPASPFDFTPFTAEPIVMPEATVYPLTGLPVTDPAAAARPALIVKIDNSGPARPQTGTNEADIVVEEVVNDSLTRFAMVFQSGGSDPVGPCRSGRIQDINIFGSLNHPLFAWSGGNATVTAAIRSSDLVELGPTRANVYFRTRDRAAPHNLYTTTSSLFARAPANAQRPAQQFQYRSPDQAIPGAAGAGVTIRLDSVVAQWTWDAGSGLYRRKTNGAVHMDRSSGQVTTNNVVVLAMNYSPGISGSPDAQTTGTGEAYVFTGGNYVHATWTRPDRLQPFSLTDDGGAQISLTPGRTFIELPRPGNTAPN